MSSYTLREMAVAGLVPAAKVGRRRIFTEEALAEYLRNEIKKQTAERRGEPEKTTLDPALSDRMPPPTNAITLTKLEAGQQIKWRDDGRSGVAGYGNSTKPRGL